MEAFFISTSVVALAEIGDKTQLLAFLLAAKFRKPIPVILGIFVATLANHGLASAIGAWATDYISPDTARWVLGISFLAMALWVLVPDTIDQEEATIGKYNAFISTLIVFFLAEMGDKTQVATVILAAKYTPIVAVIAGTTLGMMIANVPAVCLSDQIIQRVSVRLMNKLVAAIFAILGILTLVGIDTFFTV
ncbi:TMEM165/GDT1 family protein [Kordiimonas pumila]|uniref:GDT1 family protein n=1 Tax=Kordiimonas pumila TaxID=2161677 RepID=A0ABV7D2U0_9PROT|nr:TMEM165/GDT1 family protein [Kordiimonas pumila]